jgi:hypothetical protein
MHVCIKEMQFRTPKITRSDLRCQISNNRSSIAWHHMELESTWLPEVSSRRRQAPGYQLVALTAVLDGQGCI